MFLAGTGVAGLVEALARIIRRFVAAERAGLVTSGLALACLLALSPGIYALLRYQEVTQIDEPGYPPLIIYQRGATLPDAGHRTSMRHRCDLHRLVARYVGSSKRDSYSRNSR